MVRCTVQGIYRCTVMLYSNVQRRKKPALRKICPELTPDKFLNAFFSVCSRKNSQTILTKFCTPLVALNFKVYDFKLLTFPVWCYFEISIRRPVFFHCFLTIVERNNDFQNRAKSLMSKKIFILHYILVHSQCFVILLSPIFFIFVFL